MEKNTKFDALELASLIQEHAQIIGQPVDPRKPYTQLIDAVCFTGSADPEDYVYQHTIEQDTDKIYVITSTGIATLEHVTPRTPALLNFIDLNTPLYYVPFVEVLKKKEDVYARIKRQITRDMNAYENYKLLTLVDAAVDPSRLFGTASGKTKFTWPVLVDMIDSLEDYGDKFVLIAGKNVVNAMRKWDYDENKFQSVIEQLKNLNVEVIRVNGAVQTVAIDGSPSQTAVIDNDVAYLFALQSQDDTVLKPVIWIRKRLSDIRNLAGVTAEDGGAPERIILIAQNPIPVGADLTWSIGHSGLEEFTAAVVNPYGLAKFDVDA